MLEDLLEIIGVLLKLFAFGVLAITSGVVVYLLLQWWLHKSDSAAQGNEPLSESNPPSLVNITVVKWETVPFCVPGPTLQKSSSPSQETQNARLTSIGE
jgi:hypothetical protein